MNSRKLLVGALAVGIGLAAVPFNADAAWRGIRAFDCSATKGNWNFDGLYGPHTMRAVRAFQSANGLVVDGIAGPQTQKALGLKYRRTFKCGMGGNDIFLLQQALAAEGYWYGGTGKGTVKPEVPEPEPTPRIEPIPTPAGTPDWEEPPVIYTPAPSLSAEPEPTMEPVPTPEPTMEPTPTPEVEPDEVVAPTTNEPTVEVGVGTWFIPANAGSMNYDFSFQKPVYTLDATLWFWSLGLGGSLTSFNETFVTWRPNAYFQPNTYMYDGLLKYRFDNGFYQLFAGYRGVGQADMNFGTVGLAMERPIAGDWLWLDAKAQGGYGLNNAYFMDGSGGLQLRFSPVAVKLGFRHLSMNTGVDPEMFNLNGPTASLNVKF